MIDTHCHIQEDCYKDHLDQILSDCKKFGIEKLFCVGYNPKMNDRCIALAKNLSNVYAIVGIHPSEVRDVSDDDWAVLERSLSDPKVIAIGEIGLDYHYDDGPAKEMQIAAFERQIKLAHKYNLPIVIHVRDATGDLIDVLGRNREYLTSGGLVHCYGGSFESYKIFRSFGLKVAFGGALTFKNATNLRAVAAAIPLEDIVLETDCPYLSPEPVRGTTNTPANVRYVAMKLAEIKGVALKVIDTQTTANALEIFRRVGCQTKI